MDFMNFGHYMILETILRNPWTQQKAAHVTPFEVIGNKHTFATPYDKDDYSILLRL
jgi:hypothetical protein